MNFIKIFEKFQRSNSISTKSLFCGKDDCENVTEMSSSTVSSAVGGTLETRDLSVGATQQWNDRNYS